jgi:hypothetical protein
MDSRQKSRRDGVFLEMPFSKLVGTVITIDEIRYQ